MEPTTGLEPVTSSLPRRYSTTELRGHKKLKLTATHGAGNETRTRNPQLGRLMLYQLSYSRSCTKKNRQHSSCACLLRAKWWRGEDLNLRRRRRQIYSLFPLTTREPLQTRKTMNNCQTSILAPSSVFDRWSWRWDLNPQPPDYKSGALPIELRQRYDLWSELYSTSIPLQAFFCSNKKTRL